MRAGTLALGDGPVLELADLPPELAAVPGADAEADEAVGGDTCADAIVNSTLGHLGCRSLAELGPQDLKGLAAPVSAYAVTGERAVEFGERHAGGSFSAWRSRRGREHVSACRASSTARASRYDGMP